MLIGAAWFSLMLIDTQLRLTKYSSEHTSGFSPVLFKWIWHKNLHHKNQGIFLTQVGDIDILWKSDVCRVLVKGVASAKPIELKGEVHSAADGWSAEHCLQNISLTIYKHNCFSFIYLQIIWIKPCSTVVLKWVDG